VVWLYTDVEVRAPVRWTAVDACAPGGSGTSRTEAHTNGWTRSRPAACGQPISDGPFFTYRCAPFHLSPKGPAATHARLFCEVLDDSCRSADSDGGLLESAAFTLGQAAPDTEPLVVGECVLKALGADLAGEA